MPEKAMTNRGRKYWEVAGRTAGVAVLLLLAGLGGTACSDVGDSSSVPEDASEDVVGMEGSSVSADSTVEDGSEDGGEDSSTGSASSSGGSSSGFSGSSGSSSSSSS